MPSLQIQVFTPKTLLIPGKERTLRADLQSAFVEAVNIHGGELKRLFTEAPILDLVAPDIRKAHKDRNLPLLSLLWAAQNTPDVRIHVNFTTSDKIPDNIQFMAAVGEKLKLFLTKDKQKYFLPSTEIDIWLEPLHNAVYITV